MIFLSKRLLVLHRIPTFHYTLNSDIYVYAIPDLDTYLCLFMAIISELDRCTVLVKGKGLGWSLNLG